MKLERTNSPGAGEPFIHYADFSTDFFAFPSGKSTSLQKASRNEREQHLGPAAVVQALNHLIKAKLTPVT